MSNAAKIEAKTFCLGEGAMEKASTAAWRGESFLLWLVQTGRTCPAGLAQLAGKGNEMFSAGMQLATIFLQHPSGHEALWYFAFQPLQRG